MRHLKKVEHLGLKKSHRVSLVRGLVASLVLNGRLRTTERRAKLLAKRFNHLMRLVQKKDPREAIRVIPQYCHTVAASKKLLGELKKKYEGRTSGFTRMTRVGMRKGDNAELIQIELI